jgi:hypothetical protein
LDFTDFVLCMMQMEHGLQQIMERLSARQEEANPESTETVVERQELRERLVVQRRRQNFSATLK